MAKIADMRGDVMGRFHTALYLGDVRERVKILEDAGGRGWCCVCGCILLVYLGDVRERGKILEDAGGLLLQVALDQMLWLLHLIPAAFRAWLVHLPGPSLANFAGQTSRAYVLQPPCRC